MTKKIITLYIDDTSLRLMITHGKQVKKWADLPLEPGLVKNAVVIKEAEVADKIKQLAKTSKVGTKKIVVGVSGLHCLSRPIILPQLPREMLDEAVKREARRILPVPLEQLYVSWQTIPAPEGKSHVFLVAIPRNAADTVISTLRQAGLKPSLMDIKPLLLARVLPEENAVLVDVQPNEFDIVVMSGGVPQPIRTISLPAEATSWQDKLPLIRDDVDRTIKFFNSNNPEKPLTSSVPIFASGELAGEPEQCQSLSNELGYPVLPLPSLLMKCPEGLDPNHYMVNIGLAFKRLEAGKATGPLVTNLNTLPTPYQPKPISLTNIFVLPTAVIALGLLFLSVTFMQDTSADIASMRGQLDTTTQLLQQKLSQKQELAGHIAELQKYDNNILTISGRAPSERDVSSYIGNLVTGGWFGEITISNMSRVEDGGMDFTLLSSLQTESSGTSSIEVALNRLPATISLTNVSSTDGTLTVNGRSPDEDEVLSYVQDLEASGKFSEITISRMTRIEDEGMDFSLVLKTGE